MVGLTRFLFLMNLCEKSGVSANVYAGFGPLEKDGNFRGVKKLFVLQEGVLKLVLRNAKNRAFLRISENPFYSKPRDI
jgi:hypothetical protein